MKKLAVVCLLFLGVVASAQAQSKVAHVDVNKLLQEMPEMKTVQKELQDLGAKYDATLQASKKEYNTLLEKYSVEAQGLTQEDFVAKQDEFEKKSKELEDMKRSIQETQQTYQKDLQDKEQQKVTPLLQKVEVAIDKVAKAKGYDYVLNYSKQDQGLNVVMAPVLVANGTNIYDDVRKELGF